MQLKYWIGLSARSVKTYLTVNKNVICLIFLVLGLLSAYLKRLSCLPYEGCLLHTWQCILQNTFTSAHTIGYNVSPRLMTLYTQSITCRCLVFSVHSFVTIILYVFLFLTTTIYTVHWSVQCWVYNVKCTMYIVECKLLEGVPVSLRLSSLLGCQSSWAYTDHWLLYSVQHTVYNLQCTVFNVPNKGYS